MCCIAGMIGGLEKFGILGNCLQTNCPIIIYLMAESIHSSNLFGLVFSLVALNLHAERNSISLADFDYTFIEVHTYAG